MKNLYVGAAGVIWALDDLRRRGLAETTLDLPAAALRALELWRAEPDYMAGEVLPEPARVGLLTGEAGILLVACRLGRPARGRPARPHPRQPRQRGRGPDVGDARNARRRRRDGLGRPGPRVGRRARRSPRRGRPLDAAALGHELPRHRHRPWARRQRAGAPPGRRPAQRVAARESAAALARAATREDGLANWSSEGKLQWCASGAGSRLRRARLPRRGAAARRRRARLAGGRARRREGARDLPRHLGQRLRAARRVRADAGRAVARSRAPLRGARPRAGRAHARAATRSSPAAPAPRSSPPPASMPTRATRCSSATVSTEADHVRSRAMDERLERYAELVVRVGANVQPGQEVFLLPKVEHHELARALARQAYQAGASYVHVRYQDSHVLKAMIELGPDEALTYSPEWLKTFFRSMSGNAMLATTRRSRAGAARRPRRRAGGPGGAARGRADPDAADQREQRQLVRSRRSERGLGEAGLRRAGRRAAVGEGRVLHAPRRARSGRGLARSHRPAQGAGRGAERPSSGCSSVPRPRHRPHGRAAPGSALARRRQRHVDGDHIRREHADRGSLHVARRGAHRGDDSLIDAACARRADRARPRADVRERAGRQGRGRDRRGARRAATSRRSRTPTGWGRSRSSRRSRASARPGRSSTTRCSTRTRPATSRTAPVSPSSRTAIRPTASTRRNARRLHGRRARARGGRGARRRNGRAR